MLEELFDQERVQRIHENSLIQETKEAQARDIALRSLKRGMSFEEIAAILDLSTVEVQELIREAEVPS